MKGKDIFTKEEYEAIVRLLKSKVRSDKSGKSQFVRKSVSSVFTVRISRIMLVMSLTSMISNSWSKAVKSLLLGEMVVVGIFQKEINLCYQSGDSTKLMIRR